MYIHFTPVLTQVPMADTMIKQGICRIAVPFFFSASSFLLFRNIKDPKLHGKENWRKIRKFCGHLLQIYTVWSVIHVAYIAFYKYYNYGEMITLSDYVKKYFFIGINFHLWYLISSVYAVPIVYLLRRMGRRAVVLACAVGCLAQCLDLPYHLACVYDLPFMVTLSGDYFAVYRTVLLAVPLMCLGILCMEDYQKRNSGQWLIRLAATAVLYFAEMAFVYWLQGDQMEAEILLSGPVLIYYLTNWLFSLDFRLPAKWMGKALRANSTWMYCSHMLVVALFHWVFAYQGIVRYILVGGLTVVSGIPYVAVTLLKDKYKKKQQTVIVE
jgi:serine/alanine racemase